MFNAQGRVAVPITAWGGLVAEIDPAAQPEGGSPLCQDCDFLVGSVRTRPGLSPVYSAISPVQNFKWVKTFQDGSGAIRTILVAENGDLYVEDVSGNPGVLTLLQAGFASEQSVSGFSAFGRVYIALSPSGMPWQYDGVNLDRVSQEGPAASPVFQAKTVNATSAAITAFAISANVATFTADNSFSGGQLVSVTGLSIGKYLNGQVLGVSATGLSSTQFEASFAHADVPTTTDNGVATVVSSFAISSIAQPPANSLTSGNGVGLWWSAGPGSNSVGTTITVLYSIAAQDATMAAMFAAAIPVYVYLDLAGLTPGTWPSGTYLVTSMGYGPRPGSSQQSYWFTVAAPSAAAKESTGSFSYQITMATATMATPVPGVEAGDSVIITGASPPAWNAAWGVVAVPRNGFLEVTGTSASGGVATYSFTQQSGVAPVVGDLISITGTENGDGVFNVTNGVVASVGAGTFTLNGFPAATVAEQTENGQAEIYGNVIQIDPGPLASGQPSAPNPIYGNSTVGGTLSLTPGIAQSIAPGTRQGCVIFRTRQGYLTRPSPPVTFTTLQNSDSIHAENIPIGPPNVVERWIAFTEAGQEGSPGAFFYVIPEPVQTVVNNQTVVYSATVIKDNATTEATFTFTDAVLLSALEIDVPGNDLFNMIELGSSLWGFSYADRTVWGQEQNKVANFLNLTFNGGYLPNPGGYLVPPGWTVDAAFGPPPAVQLVAATQPGTFGNVLQLQNNTNVTQGAYALLRQGAYEDALGVAILQPNTAYSVRVTLRSVVAGTGNVVVDLTRFSQTGSYGPTLGSAAFGIASLTGAVSVLTLPLVTASALSEVPPDLLLRLYLQNVSAAAAVEIDRIEIFPTEAPVNYTSVRLSYIDNPEAFDLLTGNLARNDNQQPFTGAFEMYDTMYLQKSASLYSSRDVANSEPDGWSVREVSTRVGTFGPASFDTGEEWAVLANRQGIYVFTGRDPLKISQEIWRLWEYVNFAAAGTVWLRNDLVNRRILVGVPLITPNPWLPGDPVAVPTSPSHVLMLNYLGLEDVQQLAVGAQLHTTMFGNLMQIDMRRKWSPWHVACPYADFALRSDGQTRELLLCAGDGSGLIYRLKDASVQPSDNGSPVPFLYTTYGIPDLQKAAQNPAFGNGRKVWVYIQMLAQGAGNLALSFLPNTLSAKYPWKVPGGIPLAEHPFDDYERPLNVSGNRVYLQFSHAAAGSYADISRALVYGGAHPTVPMRGSASQGIAS